MRKELSAAFMAFAAVGLVTSTARAQETKPASAKPTPVKDSASLAEPNTPAAPVAFPPQYRAWKHVKSVVIHGDKSPLFAWLGGIHHIYANEKAVKGLLGGKGEYADGAAFAMDVFESPDVNGAYVEGPRKFLATIVRDAKKYAATGAWGFQAWAQGDKTKPSLKGLADQKACATCHEQAASKGNVFTEWRP